MVYLFEKANAASSIIVSSRELDLKFQLNQKGNAYKNVKSLVKESITEMKPKLKNSPPKYIIMGRVLTPLLVANERIKESFENIPEKSAADSSHIQDQLQQMEICDNNEKEEKKHATSLKVKRSCVEMNKLLDANIDIFPMGVLKAILCYADYNSLQQPLKIEPMTIGHFSTLTCEVIIIFIYIILDKCNRFKKYTFSY